MPKPVVNPLNMLAHNNSCHKKLAHKARKKPKRCTNKHPQKSTTTSSTQKVRSAIGSKVSATPHKTLHSRNRHINGYNFNALMQSYPALQPFVRPTPYGQLSIDFANPLAVKVLNTALLKHDYGINHWDIPAGALCPPIPGRVDYLHYLADLLTEKDPAIGINKAAVLDIGTGANGIYPLLGSKVYGWRFTATDINPQSLENVSRVLSKNLALQKKISLRLQTNEKSIFNGIMTPNDRFELTMCNPPFHRSLAEASAGSLRKVNNLQANRQQRPLSKALVKLNFAGQAAELWCQGGEQRFLATMIKQSADFASQCLWFSSLISKKETLKGCYQALAKLSPAIVKTIEMRQGNKVTRILVWSFHDEVQRKTWRQLRLA